MNIRSGRFNVPVGLFSKSVHSLTISCIPSQTPFTIKQEKNKQQSICKKVIPNDLLFQFYILCKLCMLYVFTLKLTGIIQKTPLPINFYDLKLMLNQSLNGKIVNNREFSVKNRRNYGILRNLQITSIFWRGGPKSMSHYVTQCGRIFEIV